MQYLGTSKYKVWNTFIRKRSYPCPQAFNPSLGAILKDSFGYQWYYFFIYQSDILQGLLPLYKIGKKLVSVPHFSYGGIWGDIDGDLFRRIINQIQNLFVTRNQDFPESGYYKLDIEELRQYPDLDLKIEIREQKTILPYTTKTKVVNYLQLSNNPEVVWKQLDANIRRKVTKAENNGIAIKKGKEELINDFFFVFSKNTLRLGSPILPIKFFRNIIKNYDYGQAEIFVAYFNNKPIGASFNTSYFNHYENNWFATLIKYNHLYTSYALHWEAIKDAIADNNQIYSFGRSTINSGTHQYKQQWTKKEQELVWNFTHKPFSVSRFPSFGRKIWRLLPRKLAIEISKPVMRWIY